MRLHVSSKEYVKVPLSGEEGGVPIDPTGLTVEMAFPENGSDPTTWFTAVVETVTTTTPDTYRVKCLVGPGGTATLPVGRYRPFVRLTDNPEIPWLESPDILEIYSHAA